MKYSEKSLNENDLETILEDSIENLMIIISGIDIMVHIILNMLLLLVKVNMVNRFVFFESIARI